MSSSDTYSKSNESNPDTTKREDAKLNEIGMEQIKELLADKRFRELLSLYILMKGPKDNDKSVEISKNVWENLSTVLRTESKPADQVSDYVRLKQQMEEEAHKRFVQQIEEAQARINKRISDLDRLKREKAVLLA